MDKIDEKIIAELDKDPRMPLTKLAKHVRVSQQVADYRVKKLVNEGIITKFGAIINLKTLQQEHYRLFFTFNAKKEFSYGSIFDHLKKQKGVYWAARIGGKYDLLITLFVFDFEELDRFIDNFNNQFPGLIKDYKACYGLEYKLFKHKFISHDNSSVSYGYNDKPIKIDELDKFILEKLSENCRTSSLEIANQKKVSYKTIIHRIKRMESEKLLLGCRMFIKDGKYKPFGMLLSFKEYSKKAESDLISYLSSHEKVTQIVRMFGLWNLFIHVREEDNERLQDLLVTIRDKFGIIDNYELIPIFEDISINLMPL